MTRQHNLMLAALVALALGTAWYLSDPVYSPFARREMPEFVPEPVPVVVEEMAGEEEEEAAGERLVSPQPECRYAGFSEMIDWTLAAMRTRIEVTRAVQDAASAREYLHRTLPELGGRAMGSMQTLMAALDPKEALDCPSVQAIRERRGDITKVWNEWQQAEAEMRVRAAAAGYYGVAELAEQP